MNPKQQSKCNRIIVINNYLKCTWDKTGQETKDKTGQMDTKTRPLYMLSKRDPPQTQGHKD